MKIEVSNLGALKWAEFTLGDLTIICGGNNTGKTYATYALYGFLDSWRKVISVPIPKGTITNLLNDGVVHLNLTDYIEKIDDLLEEGCRKYSNDLHMVFSASKEKFESSTFFIYFDQFDQVNYDVKSFQFEQRSGTSKTSLLSISKEKNTMKIVVSLLVDGKDIKLPHDIIARHISYVLKNILFESHFPEPFIVSAERTGAAVFRRQLSFARERLLNEIHKTHNDAQEAELLFRMYKYYALPIERNIAFISELSSLKKENSFIMENHFEILKDFSNIVGGDYIVTNDDELYYVPNDKEIRLTMDESSSAVRSLLDIGFYLKHLAKPGDILMVDEPELNLHPENQRKVARLFARLMNIGIKVFITTHSDYIIKELNTLIMLNHDKPHLKMIMKEEGYQQAELIRADQVRVYMAEKDDKGFNTLTAADIDPEMGIEARTFDITIDTMNSIQRDIVWGGE